MTAVGEHCGENPIALLRIPCGYVINRRMPEQETPKPDARHHDICYLGCLGLEIAGWHGMAFGRVDLFPGFVSCTLTGSALVQTPHTSKNPRLQFITQKGVAKRVGKCRRNRTGPVHCDHVKLILRNASTQVSLNGDPSDT